ncbi:hypothetical protein [Actinoallomurus sp. NPDC052274]|uniref:hypothetical protein n=1 Tax=Actinoallomurus sp. NPDC052274 TaxID=3155420 RepID=UPI00341A50AC
MTLGATAANAASSHRNWTRVNAQGYSNAAGVVFHPKGDKFDVYYNENLHVSGTVHLLWRYKGSETIHRKDWSTLVGVYHAKYNMKEHKKIYFELCVAQYCSPTVWYGTT